MVGATTKILVVLNNKNHLRVLILELLENSDQIHLFKTVLIDLLVNVEEIEHIRKLALSCLINLKSENLLSVFNTLVHLGDSSSLELASIMVKELGVNYIGREITASFLKTLSALYPHSHPPLENVIGKRHFIKTLIGSFLEEDTQWFLNHLSAQMVCTCGATDDYGCRCRLGISKVIGVLLDRYFEVKIDQFDPEMLWQWMRNLIFHDSIAPSQSKSVEVLQSNSVLRQAVQLAALRDIWRLKCNFNGWIIHSGLYFREMTLIG